MHQPESKDKLVFWAAPKTGAKSCRYTQRSKLLLLKPKGKNLRSVLRPLFSTIVVLLLAANPIAAHPLIPRSSVTGAQELPTLAPLVKGIAAGVVSINVVLAPKPKPAVPPGVMTDPILRGFFGIPTIPKLTSSGSGIVIDGQHGYIATAYHVVQDASRIMVTFGDRREADAVVVGSDPATDIAVIKVPEKNLTSIPFADSNRLNVGDFVVAIGFPFNLGQTITLGVVSGLNRSPTFDESDGPAGQVQYENLIQTDASINPGSSGGALLNLRGQLEGLDDAIVDLGSNNTGIGFAIPVNVLRAISDQLIQYGSVQRGEVGISVADTDRDVLRKFNLPAGQSGVVVTGVSPGSSAERAGLRAGDVMTAVGATPVNSVSELRVQLAILRTGSIAELRVLRGGRLLSVKAAVSQSKHKPAAAGSSAAVSDDTWV